MTRRHPFFAIAVLGFCAWQSRGLFDAWRHAPFDHLGWLAFAVWVLPVALTLCRNGAAIEINESLLLAAALCSLIGAATDINLVQHIAFAAALGIFAYSKRRLAVWLATAAAWMPVFGWLTSNFGTGRVAFVRIVAAVAASAWACWTLRVEETKCAA